MEFRYIVFSLSVSVASLLITTEILAASDTKKSATPASELSCSKQARRIAKITDRTKRREYIKQCREKRENEEKLAKQKEDSK